MIGSQKDFDEAFEKECAHYLEYLYTLANKNYSDCPDIDTLVQDTLTVLLFKRQRGEIVETPKGFLSAVLKNKHNAYLRQKYRADIVEYTDDVLDASCNDFEETQEHERLCEEYEAVRREIGRLIQIYREVTIRHYIHGQTIEEIAKALNIPRGTVLSRLSTARSQIKEGLENMEKYSQISYEPKTASIGIWGGAGLNGEPFSLMRSPIESNILYLAYETPISIRGIADMMGMPCAYVEPFVNALIEGEMMGRTPGGLVYTRCFMQRYEDAFGDIPAQEALAAKYAKQVWEIVWRHVEPLTTREAFAQMSDKQKATMILFVMNQTLNSIVIQSHPHPENAPASPPERPNAGKWLATVTVYEQGQKRNSPYEASGPVHVYYSKNNDGKYDCQLFDRQSIFGDAHWAYQTFRYKCSLQSILRFYASFLPCDIKTDNNLLYDLIPEFEKLCILSRGEDGEIKLDIPALPFDEVTNHWNPAEKEIKKELLALLSKELSALWEKTKHRVPKHVDEAAYFTHEGALMAYTTAQMLAIVKQNLLPYPVVIGKTPLIYIAYRKRDE